MIGEVRATDAGHRVEVDGHGFIQTDSNFATTAENIYAIGDVIGNPMLAHKALHEGNVLADGKPDQIIYI